MGMTQTRTVKSFSGDFVAEERVGKFERAGIRALALQINAADASAGVGKRRDGALRA